MSTTTDVSNPQQIAERIDGIIRELEQLRRQLVKPVDRPAQGLTDQLFGALGHGAWREYDLDLDWQRFER